MTTTHTPTPYHVHDGAQLTIEADSPEGGRFVIAEMNEWNPEYHPDMPGDDRATAAFLVHAANHHDALLEAAQWALAHITGDGVCLDAGTTADGLRAAIAAASSRRILSESATE